MRTAVPALAPLAAFSSSAIHFSGSSGGFAAGGREDSSWIAAALLPDWRAWRTRP